MVDHTRVVYDSFDENVLTELKPHQEKSVMLTFDDGPGRVLPQILDILHKEDVKAAFFWQSRLLHHKRPWKRVLNEGHLLGNHSTNHKDLTRLSYKEQLQDIEQCKKTIEHVTGQSLKYFRPPFGQYNGDTIKAAKSLGMEMVLWRIASMDWELKDDPHQIIRYVVDNLEDCAIILLHELTQTVEILPQLITEIRKEGYGFKLI